MINKVSYYCYYYYFSGWSKGTLSSMGTEFINLGCTLREYRGVGSV